MVDLSGNTEFKAELPDEGAKVVFVPIFYSEDFSGRNSIKYSDINELASKSWHLFIGEGKLVGALMEKFLLRFTEASVISGLVKFLGADKAIKVLENCNYHFGDNFKQLLKGFNL